MLAVPTHDPPPIKAITLRGHFEELFTVAHKIREQAQFVTNEVWPDTEDEDVAEVTFEQQPGQHKLTKDSVKRILAAEQVAETIEIIYNRGK